MSKIKVGITTRKEANIWSNGLDQNIYFLVKMLIEMGYDAELVSEDPAAKGLLDLKVIQLSLSNVNSFDIILEVAHPLSERVGNYFNSKGKPLVGIKYGNSYMIDLESYIDKGSDRSKNSLGVNLPIRNREVWVSEQFYKFKDYYEVLCRTNIKIIPYIWDPSILMLKDEGYHLQPMKKEAVDFKKIAIVEPNINILKNCIIPLSICEMSYIKNPEIIKEVYCFGSKHLDKNKVFLEYLRYLNIHKNKITSYESRHPIYKIFKDNIANTIVTTQLYNEQNYVYLEALFYKRNLIHNSPYFKDVGYYYPEFDVNKGSEVLLDSIENFNQAKHQESYEEKLWEMSIHNPKNQEKMKDLIESVL